MNITGVIKAIDVPDDTCLTTVRDLVLQLERLLAVQFDAERITNVLVSPSEPDTAGRDVIWFKIDNSGNFIGIFIFVQGSWYQMFPPPSEIFLIHGNSELPPPGYMVITQDTPGFNDPMIDKLHESWYPAPATTDDPGPYQIFHVVYVGL